MSSRDRVVDKAPGFAGQKSALPLESYGITNAALVQNFFLHHKQLNKSPGCALYGEAGAGVGTGGTTSLHAFKDTLIAQRGLDLAINLFTPYWNTNVFTYTQGLLTSPKRLQGAVYRDKLFLTNSQDVMFLAYRENAPVSPGSAPPKLGLDPLDSIDSTKFANVGAGNVNNEDHYYTIALYDSNTNTESPCASALPSTDGLYETSANGFFGHVPAPYNPGIAAKVYINGAYLKTVLTAAQVASGGRVTHFIVYRAGPKVNGLFTSFFRVPMRDGGTYDGSVILPIAALSGNTTGGAVPAASQIDDFVDNTADANLPAISPPDNNSPPPTPARLLAALQRANGFYSAPESWQLKDYSGFRHMRFFRDQLFGIGAHGFGFTVSQDIPLAKDITQKVTGKVAQFRDLLHGSEVYQPDYWPYRWEVGKGDGQEAIALGVLGDVALLVFKEHSAYYLSGSGPDNYVLRIMDPLRGCVNEGTVQETPLGVITLDRSGFVLWNKIGQGTPLSDDVHDVIEKIQFHYASVFYSTYEPKLKIYRCAVVVPGSQTPNLTFVLDLDSMQWTFEQGEEGLCRVQFSVNQVNYTSYAASQAGANDQLDIGKIYDFVGSKLSGKIFDYSSVANTNGQAGMPIYATWTSGTINFGDDQHKKRLNWLYLRAKSYGGWTVDIEVIPDYDESRKYTVLNWNSTVSQSQWYSSDIATDGSLLWDDGTGNVGGVWASDGQSLQVSKIPIKCIGKTFQVRITNKDPTGANYGFAVESLSAEGCMLGR